MRQKLLTSIFIVITLLLTNKQLNKKQLLHYQSNEQLKSAARFPIGAAVNPFLLKKDTLYSNTVIREFNSITSENALKFATLRPKLTSFNFSEGDFLVKFAQQNNMRIHGHCLVWHQSIPNWLNEFKGDSTAWEQLMKQHIQSVMRHYKGKIKSWDVVNEAFNKDGIIRTIDENKSSKYRKNYWAINLGNDYIARAFKYAHDADKDALLFYNDFGQETQPEKINAIVRLVLDFKKRKIPIHGIGLQMHLNLAIRDKDIKIALQKLAATGLLIHISELDISINPKNNYFITYNQSNIKKQDDLYNSVSLNYKTIVPKKQQFGITFWNVGDHDSWIRNYYKREDWPLLFDDNYHKKSAYDSFIKGLR